MMFLARVLPGADPQVYELSGALFFVPRSWGFVSYRRGASAIGHTRAEAVRAATLQLGQPFSRDLAESMALKYAHKPAVLRVRLRRMQTVERIA